MAKKITVDRLSDEIMDALEEYKEMTDEVVQTAVDTVSKETKKIVQAGSPIKTGGYQNGWSVKKTSAKAGQVSITVYNRKKPGLTHLLEKGMPNAAAGVSRDSRTSLRRSNTPSASWKTKSKGG